MHTATADDVRVECRSVPKRISGVVAVDDVSFMIRFRLAGAPCVTGCPVGAAG